MEVNRREFPLVAIVGRPNVGKSSLFNALIQKKKSLVAPVEGVTRDIVESFWEWEESCGTQYRCTLWDTGGMSQSLSHDFIEATLSLARMAIQKADLVLFVVDGRRGITQDDALIAEQLRKQKFAQTFVIVNKVDHEHHEKDAQEFRSLGFPAIFQVSCAHRLGISDLTESIGQFFTRQGVLSSPGNSSSQEEFSSNEVFCTLLGKPNAGKSSFFNRIIGKERSIVSDIAGTTRDVLSESADYKGKIFHFFDTAGFRRRSKVVDLLEKDSLKKALWAVRKSEVVIFLIDAATGKVTEQDKKLLDLIVKEKRGIVVGLNKWDIVPPKERKLWKERLEFYLKDAKYFPIIPFSTREGRGIYKLLDAVWRVKENYHNKIKARELTLFLKERVKEKPPFSKWGTLKIFYGSQVRQTPPEFEIFVNNAKILTPSYERYLVHSLYEKFPLEGVPFSLVFKNRR